MTFGKRWWIFILERFSPSTHGLMALVLFYGNWQVARHTVENSLPVYPLTTLVITLFIFLRLRIFDDIKDYETDCRINPDRPLARGLIGIKEAKTVVFFLASLEGILSLYIGQNVFICWLLLCVYSVLMYREFFVGSWLRPKMELYALSHTLIAIWIGLLIAAAATTLPLSKLPLFCIVFSLSNWLVFNVFEFSRKTYGKNEEPEREETYSKRLTPTGAGILSLVNAWGGIASAFSVLRALAPESPYALLLGILATASLLLSIAYASKPLQPQSVWFRKGMALYIIFFYLVAGLCLLH